MLLLTPEETAFVAEFEASAEAINAELQAFRACPTPPPGRPGNKSEKKS